MTKTNQPSLVFQRSEISLLLHYDAIPRAKQKKQDHQRTEWGAGSLVVGRTFTYNVGTAMDITFSTKLVCVLYRQPWFYC